MLNEYKLSKYNVFFEKQGKHYVWNTLSNALIELDSNDIIYLENFTGNNDKSQYFQTLKDNGCIVASTYDEIGKVIADEQTVMLNPTPKRMGFTIAPGMGCNYNCIYCFENARDANLNMDELTENNVANFIIKSLEQNSCVDRCQITWFGGEPLLYIDTILSLSKKIISFCDKNSILYRAGIISNGRFLSEDVIDILTECRVTQAQITLDGMETTYCINKKASPQDFWIVINNIKKAANIFKINVRINVGVNTDMNEIFELTDLLLRDNQLDGKINIYLGFLRDYKVSVEEEKKRHGVHLIQEQQFIEYLKDNFGIHNYANHFPRRRLSSCLQVCSANSCIGPNGELYRCEHYFGNSESIIGDVIDGKYFNNADRRFYKFNHLPKCLACSFFPVCLGGCLDDQINNRLIVDCEKYCEHLIRLKLMEVK